MKKKLLGQLTGLSIGLCMVAMTSALHAQDQKGDWAMTGGDAAQSGWQKDEAGMTPESVAAHFKFLWKFNLGKAAKSPLSYSEPIMVNRTYQRPGLQGLCIRNIRRHAIRR